MAERDYNHDGKNDWVDDQIEQDAFNHYGDKQSRSQSSSFGCSNALLLLILLIVGVLWIIGKLYDLGAPEWIALPILALAIFPLVRILNMKG